MTRLPHTHATWAVTYPDSGGTRPEHFATETARRVRIVGLTARGITTAISWDGAEIRNRCECGEGAA